jgi:hypothetical protein
MVGPDVLASSRTATQLLRLHDTQLRLDAKAVRHGGLSGCRLTGAAIFASSSAAVRALRSVVTPVRARWRRGSVLVGQLRLLPAEYKAERVTDRICEDAVVALEFPRQPGRAKLQDLPLRGFHIIDTDVYMQLLGTLRVPPRPCCPVRNALKCQLACPGSEPMTAKSSVSSLICLPRTAA